jgi:hypothetical protein
MKGTSDEFYLRGDRFKPSYWLKCHPGGKSENGKALCETKLAIDDRLKLKYSFTKTDLLPHHDKVREKVIEKIRQWQQPPIHFGTD